MSHFCHVSHDGQNPSLTLGKPTLSQSERGYIQIFESTFLFTTRLRRGGALVEG